MAEIPSHHTAISYLSYCFNHSDISILSNKYWIAIISLQWADALFQQLSVGHKIYIVLGTTFGWIGTISPLPPSGKRKGEMRKGIEIVTTNLQSAAGYLSWIHVIDADSWGNHQGSTGQWNLLGYIGKCATCRKFLPIVKISSQFEGSHHKMKMQGDIHLLTNSYFLN